MQPHYYLMKGKKILRLEGDVSFGSLPFEVRSMLFEESIVMDQDQANWRVVIFRDEIMEQTEFLDWLSSDEALMAQEEELDLIAN